MLRLSNSFPLDAALYPFDKPKAEDPNISALVGEEGVYTVAVPKILLELFLRLAVMVSPLVDRLIFDTDRYPIELPSIKLLSFMVTEDPLAWYILKDVLYTVVVEDSIVFQKYVVVGVVVLVNQLYVVTKLVYLVFQV